MASLPKRPRLAAGVWARRHVIDGEETVMLKGPGFDGVMQIGGAAWRALTFADGTRDPLGVRLACERDGVVWTEDEMTELFTDLCEVGFLEDGFEPAPPDAGESASARDARRLDVLPGFTLACDGGGGCCRFYDTVLFRPEEAERARRLINLGDRTSAEMFTPYFGGQLDRANWTARHIEGRCAFLDDDLRCGLHRIGGPSAKPLGCRTYPVVCVDDGERIRVSVGPECACVFASIGRDDGEPLVNPDAVTLGDLGTEVILSALPDEIELSSTSNLRASRAALRQWADNLADYLAVADDDMAALAWTLATVVDSDGLEMSLPIVVRPPAAESWLGWLGTAAKGAADDDESWRARDDLHRRVTQWVANSLGDDLDLEALRTPAVEVERWYLLTLNHAYRLAPDGRSLADGLRDRAVRILTARAMRAHPPASADPSFRFPLALLEAAMRDSSMGKYSPVHSV